MPFLSAHLRIFTILKRRRGANSRSPSWVLLFSLYPTNRFRSSVVVSKDVCSLVFPYGEWVLRFFFLFFVFLEEV